MAASPGDILARAAGHRLLFPTHSFCTDKPRDGAAVASGFAALSPVEILGRTRDGCEYRFPRNSASKPRVRAVQATGTIPVERLKRSRVISAMV